MRPRIPGYARLRPVGEGLGGVVYRAEPIRGGPPVAVKLLQPDSPEAAPRVLERLRREARLLAEHPHPCLVPLLEAHLEEEPHYLVFAWMEGGDLVDALAEAGGRMPLARAVPALGRVARALEHLHERGVLHRDVKPDNVLLDGAGVAYLGDLGLGQDAGDPRLTRTGMVMGTPGYLAPELLEGQEHSVATDLYALGALVVVACTGRMAPLEGWSPSELEPVLDPLPPSLAGLVRACLERDPRARPASAGAVASQLEALRASLLRPSRAGTRPRTGTRRVSLLSRLEPLAPRPRPPRSPGPGGAGAALGLFLAGALVLLEALLPGGARPPTRQPLMPPGVAPRLAVGHPDAWAGRPGGRVLRLRPGLEVEVLPALEDPGPDLRLEAGGGDGVLATWDDGPVLWGASAGWSTLAPAASGRRLVPGSPCWLDVEGLRCAPPGGEPWSRPGRRLAVGVGPRVLSFDPVGAFGWDLPGQPRAGPAFAVPGVVPRALVGGPWGAAGLFQRPAPGPGEGEQLLLFAAATGGGQLELRREVELHPGPDGEPPGVQLALGPAGPVAYLEGEGWPPALLLEGDPPRLLVLPPELPRELAFLGIAADAAWLRDGAEVLALALEDGRVLRRLELSLGEAAAWPAGGGVLAVTPEGSLELLGR